MYSQQVTILFRNSLFAAGIASWLAEAGFSAVTLLDAGQGNLPERIQMQHPDVVIYDSSDMNVMDDMCFFSILRCVPGVPILQVDYEKEEVQIYYSKQKVAHEMGEFISLMQNITLPTD